MRVAVIADVHANLAALQAVAADFGSIDEVWCLGDMVGYGPCPNECVDWLRRIRHICITGNHDSAVVGQIPVDDFNPDAAAAVRWTAEVLSTDNWAYLEDLPLTSCISGFTLVHGSPRHPIWEYVISQEVASLSFPYFKTRYCFVGHSHIPLIFAETSETVVPRPHYGEPVPLGEERLIINPGSVGQPRDGYADARYIQLDTEAATIEYRAVPYDIKHTQRQMKRAGLPSMLAGRLAYGR